MSWEWEYAFEAEEAGPTRLLKSDHRTPRRCLTSNRRAAQLWKNLVAVDLTFYKSPLMQEFRAEARAEARAKGRAESILAVLEARGVDVPQAVRERITGCDDLEILHRWLRRAATASSADEIFVEE